MDHKNELKDKMENKMENKMEQNLVAEKSEGKEADGAKFCPCCGRHCDLTDVHCDYGRDYIRTGIIVMKKRGGNKPQTEAEGHEGHEGHREHRGHEGHEGHREHRGHEDHEGHREHKSPAHCCATDEDGQLVSNLRNLGHTMRFLFGGKGSQKRILSILCEEGSVTQRKLTAKMGIQPGSASEVIGKLESAGLIVRIQSQTDRRTTDIQLTEEGKKKAQEAVEERRLQRQEMFSCLTWEEKTTLLELTNKLTADWNSRYGDAGSEREDGKGERHPGRHHHH